MHLSLNLATFPPTLRFALTTRFMGGLTTYSSFNYETIKLAQDGAWAGAALNFGLSTVACFLLPSFMATLGLPPAALGPSKASPTRAPAS